MKKLFAICFALLAISFIAAELISYNQPAPKHPYYLHPTICDTIYFNNYFTKPKQAK